MWRFHTKDWKYRTRRETIRRSSLLLWRVFYKCICKNLYSINWRWCLLHFRFVFWNSCGRYVACILGVTCRHFSMRNACISRDKKGAAHIRLNYDILWSQFAETNCMFEFLLGKYPISKNKSSKMESGKWSYDLFKINKISACFRKRPHGFQNFIQTLVGYY